MLNFHLIQFNLTQLGCIRFKNVIRLGHGYSD
nr:MAG TPA: hypothetical protein [Caudoviricetes sp.]